MALTSINIQYIQATGIVELSNVTMNGNVIIPLNSTADITPKNIKKHIRVAATTIKSGGEAIMLMISLRSIRTTRNPVSGVLETTGIDLAKYTEA